jgi:hypothetical protein
VTLPVPAPGLVIRYSYLWHADYLEGREDGQKDRPCVLVAAVSSSEGETGVLVIPITHSAPTSANSVEIPLLIKQRLRLDAARSWIMLSEWNEFAWPGPDLRPVGRGEITTFTYGFLPPGFFATIRDRFFALSQSGKARRVTRTE